jgi:hypothetical protein
MVFFMSVPSCANDVCTAGNRHKEHHLPPCAGRGEALLLPQANGQQRAVKNNKRAEKNSFYFSIIPAPCDHEFHTSSLWLKKIFNFSE